MITSIGSAIFFSSSVRSKNGHARALHAAHGHGMALGRAVGELLLELGPAARVLVAVGDARRAGAVELGHGRHALRSMRWAKASHSSLKRLPWRRDRWRRRRRPPRSPATRALPGWRMANSSAAVAPIDRPQRWAVVDAQRRHHVGGIVGGARLRIGGDVVRHVRRRPAARGVGDAAVAPREIADLRLPAHDSGRRTRAGTAAARPAPVSS